MIIELVPDWVVRMAGRQDFMAYWGIRTYLRAGFIFVFQRHYKKVFQARRTVAAYCVPIWLNGMGHLPRCI